MIFADIDLAELIDDLDAINEYDEPQGNVCTECGDDVGVLFGAIGLCAGCREEAVALVA